MNRQCILSIVLSMCVAAVSACSGNVAYEPAIANGDAQQGLQVLKHYECNVCHVIPGVSGTRSYVGPPLDNYRHNVYVAGKFANTPDNLIAWIVNPPSLAPETAMPNVGVSTIEARDIAAYLYSLQ
jgi:cytochrome c